MIYLLLDLEFVKKFRAVLLAVQNDDIMGLRTEKAKKFVEDIQILIRKLAAPMDSDIAFLEWLYKSLEKVVGEERFYKKELWTKFHVLRSTVRQEILTAIKLDELFVSSIFNSSNFY